VSQSSPGFAQLLGKLGAHVGVASDPTRARILTLARRRYREQGFARLPVEALCSELGIAKKTFYRFFADKHDLVHALVADSFVRWLPELARLDRTGDEDLVGTLNHLLEMSAAEWSARFLADIQTHLPDLWNTPRRRWPRSSA
jgi:AcrR family transcriptional regulator